MRSLRGLVMAVAVLTMLLAPASGAGQPFEGRAFTLTAAGDIITHGMLTTAADRYQPGYGWDFTPMMAEIEPWIAPADLAVCHLESTMTATNTGISGYPRFVGPRELATAIAGAGWDACSVASNHSMDSGFAGVVQTLDLLDAAGVAHSGTARTEEERLPAIYDVSGVTVGHISATFSTNGIPIPAAHPYAVNLLDVERVIADAAWAREQGADFVFASLHWGSEYVVHPTGSQRSIADRLTASPDIDLIIGHHAHVVQPIDIVNGKYVVYGVGNHLTNQFSRWGPSYYATEDGLMVHVQVIEQRDGSFAVTGIEITPTWVSFPDYVVHSAADVVLRGAPGAGAAAASFQRTVERALMLDPPGVTVTATPWPEVACEGSRATIVGSVDDDTITGTPDADIIAARAGDDLVVGNGGRDIVCGGPGDDVLVGGDGADLLFGGPGQDVLVGSLTDRLFGGEGRDRCVSRAPLRECETS